MAFTRTEGGGSSTSRTRTGGGGSGFRPAPIAPSAPTQHSFGKAVTGGGSNMFSAPGGGSGGGTYGGGGGSGYTGGSGIMDVGAPALPMVTKDDFLNSDDVYLAALSRYNKQFDDLDADITRRRGDYQTQFDNSVKDLGRLADGSWDFQNQQTAAGRGFQALIQDFAARGLLHSGDYLRSSDDLKASLGKQYTGMNDARSQFNEGLNSERNSGVSSRDAGQAQARAEALARYAQLYGAV